MSGSERLWDIGLRTDKEALDLSLRTTLRDPKNLTSNKILALLLVVGMGPPTGAEGVIPTPPGHLPSPASFFCWEGKILGAKASQAL